MFFCPSFLKIKSVYNNRSNKFYLCIFDQLKIGTGMLLIFQLSKTNFIESIRSVWFDPCLFYGSGSGKKSLHQTVSGCRNSDILSNLALESSLKMVCFNIVGRLSG